MLLEGDVFAFDTGFLGSVQKVILETVCERFSGDVEGNVVPLDIVIVNVGARSYNAVVIYK